MDIVIIEDEKTAAENLEKLLSKLNEPIHVLAKIESVKDAVAWLQEYVPDLIFLDVHLADDICFKIFDQVEISTPIIFTTAYDQYALRAFKLNSIDYLLKPIDLNELERSIRKFNSLRSSTNVDLEGLINTFQQPIRQSQKRFIVTAGEKIKSIPVEQIAYFYGQDKYVYIITNENQRFILDQTLNRLEETLDPDTFFRVNRQFIVGYSAIRNMYAYSRSRVKLELEPLNKEEIIVSIDRSGSFKKWLNR
ncbi:MAG: LytTR family DNA-binding domain-containing protein [Bacteroidota bacterium]